MDVTLTLELPRDQLSVPVVRRLLGQALGVLGVEQEVTADLELALTEACTNVLEHSEDGSEYAVTARVFDTTCVLEVVDHGKGFNATGQGRTDAASSAEGGRGIQLMRALVDRVDFDPADGQGTRVRLEKRLRFARGSALEQWEGARLAP